MGKISFTEIVHNSLLTKLFVSVSIMMLKAEGRLGRYAVPLPCTIVCHFVAEIFQSSLGMRLKLYSNLTLTSRTAYSEFPPKSPSSKRVP